ncbi:MAG TPA: GNAT family N-acetyltransferase [Chitinophagaceae bacterium]
MQIRPVTLDDAASVLAIYQPYVEHTAATFETEVPSLKDFEARILHYSASYPWLVAVQSNEIVGYAYASRHRERAAYQWCVESSVYVNEANHGSGIAGALYNELFGGLRQLGYINVYAGITLPNPKSYAFHSKMGFEPVGVYRNIGYKLGRWHDVAWLTKTLNPHPDHPLPPKTSRFH